MLKKYISKKNFVLIFIMFSAVILIGGSMLLYDKVSKIKSDYEEINSVAVKNMSLLMDTAFDEAVMIIANIEIDNYVRSYVFTGNSEEIFDDIDEKVKLKLQSYVGINEYIESICVYSSDKKRVNTETGEDIYESFEYIDDICKDSKDGETIITPLKGIDKSSERFCVCKRLTEWDKYGYVMMKINMRRLVSVLADRNAELSYYVYNDDEILYSRNGRDVFLKEGVLRNGFYKDSSRVYNVSSISSSKYDWKYARGYVCKDYNKEILMSVALNILIMLLLILASTIPAYFISERISKPVKRLSLLFSGNTYLDDKMDEDVRVVAEKILNIINSNAKLKSELEQKIAQLNDNRIANLQAQINPHFLYNSLNIINWTVFEEAGADSKSMKMIAELADLLAYTTNLSDVFVRFSDEIHNTKLYVNLLKYRYNNSFDVVFDVDAELNDIKIVKLCLQPIIENSVYHGFGKKESDKLINIRAYIKNDDVYIIIKDNGVGIEKEKMKLLKQSLDNCDGLLKEHIGLANVKNRLKLLYGDEADLFITSVLGEGTTVVLKFLYEDFNNRIV